MRKLSLDQARRIALAAQGFADPAPSGKVDVRHVRRAIDRMGLIQIDSVNVVVRSHYMPLFSRLGPYEQTLLDRLAYERSELFEYWGHAASFIPTETFPLYRHRMDKHRPDRDMNELLAKDPLLFDRVLDEVSNRGPISISDLEQPGARTGPWWGWSDGKLALEWLFLKGEISCAYRKNFTRYYDLTERVIPSSAYNRAAVTPEEAHREFLVMAARSFGIATDDELADYYRIKIPEARPRLKELVEDGRLIEADVEGWDRPTYLDPQARTPRRVRASALLTPFDPVVWNRDRAKRLFDFDYKIEIYVPEPKRIYGYYVMPYLLDQELVARVDLKSDRQNGRLIVKGSFLEEGQTAGRVADQLAVDLGQMADWLGLNEVDIGPRGDLAAELAKRFTPDGRVRGT